MFGLKWLVDHGVLPKERLEEYYASYVAGIFRTVRFGTGEAHGAGGDDGVQLSVGAGRDHAEATDATRRLREDAGAIDALAKELLDRRRPATARAPRRGSRSTTRCRPT